MGMENGGQMENHDHEIVTAQITAQQNPVLPPESLPRDRSSAFKVFAAHPSPQLIALALGAAIIVRAVIAPFSWVDAVVVLVVWAYFPVNEWVIHVFMLHYTPRTLFGHTLDFHLPKTHRWHHAEPWKLEWVFIPRHIHLLVFPAVAAVVMLAGVWRGPMLSGVTIYLLLGLHYEWVHYLAHIHWCPDNAYYRRRVQEHRWHHFRNENYWWGVSMGLGDRLFKTAPSVGDVGRTGTTGTLRGNGRTL